MAIDPKVIELQKQLQLAGQNWLKQSGTVDEDTRKAIANINKAQGFGKGIGESALTQQTMDYLSQYKPKTQEVKQETPVTEEIKQAITQPQTAQAPSYSPVTDNSGLINSQYNNLISALKAQIQQSINNKNQQIANTPQQYQPLKNQNDVNAVNNLRSVLEQNINSGDRGGVGRQNALNVNTARDNNLNAINLEQENQINALKNDIANLTLEGDIQGAQLTAQQLQALIANNQYMDNQNYARQQDQFNNGLSLANLLGNYQGIPTLAQQQFDYTKEWNTIQRQDELNDKAWERSENNPAYKAQLLNNEILQLQLSNLPTQLKQEAALLAQQVESGRVDIDTAKEQLRRLKSSYSGGSSRLKSSYSGGSSSSSSSNDPLAKYFK